MANHLLLTTAISLCLIGCQTESPWTVSAIETFTPTYDSARLIYPYHIPGQGMTLEIFEANGQFSTHINLVHHSLSSLYHSAYVLTLSTSSERHEETAYLHQGGQRLTLTDRAQDLLLTFLFDQQDVTITIGNISQTISSQGFKEAYQKFTQKNTD